MITTFQAPKLRERKPRQSNLANLMNMVKQPMLSSAPMPIQMPKKNIGVAPIKPPTSWQEFSRAVPRGDMSEAQYASAYKSWIKDTDAENPTSYKEFALAVPQGDMSNEDYGKKYLEHLNRAKRSTVQNLDDPNAKLGLEEIKNLVDAEGRPVRVSAGGVTRQQAADNGWYYKKASTDAANTKERELGSLTNIMESMATLFSEGADISGASGAIESFLSGNDPISAGANVLANMADLERLNGKSIALLSLSNKFASLNAKLLSGADFTEGAEIRMGKFSPSAGQPANVFYTNMRQTWNGLQYEANLARKQNGLPPLPKKPLPKAIATPWDQLPRNQKKDIEKAVEVNDKIKGPTARPAPSKVMPQGGEDEFYMYRLNPDTGKLQVKEK